MMAPIIKRRIACVLLLVAVAVLAPVQAQLASSESNALIQIYIDSFSGGTSALNSLAVPWSTDTSTACNSPSWTGIGCSGGHITSLSLAGVAYNGIIPSNIDGLIYLQHLYLSNAGITGTIPATLYNITTLSAIDLSNNALDLCDSPAPAWGSNITSGGYCNVAGQNPSSAVCSTGCCGCDAVWSASCTSNVAVCAPCTGVAPFEVETTCINGAWTVRNSYTGPLTVNGSVLIMGDYTLPKTDLLVFNGWSSTLNVTGKATIQESITFFVTDAEVSTLNSLGTYTKHSVYYMTTKSGSSTSGSAVRLVANARRHCNIPRINPNGNAYLYGASMNSFNNCNTGWILGVSIGVPLVVGLLAGLLPALCS